MRQSPRADHMLKTRKNSSVSIFSPHKRSQWNRPGSDGALDACDAPELEQIQQSKVDIQAVFRRFAVQAVVLH